MKMKMKLKWSTVAVAALLTGCVTANDVCGQPEDGWQAKDVAEWIDCRDQFETTTESISDVFQDLSKSQ